MALTCCLLAGLKSRVPMSFENITLSKASLQKVTLPSVHLIGHSSSSEAGYIKDGLVFWLDGIDKGGEEGKWIDLVGGVEFQPDTSAEWGDDFFSGTLLASVGVAYPYRESTIEFAMNNRIVYSSNVLWLNSGVCGSICGGTTLTNLIIGQCHGYSLSFSTQRIQQAGPQCVSANANLMLHNLIADYNAGVFDYWTNRVPYARLYIKNIEMHSIRIYDRLLSEAEMRHNQEVDRKRFKLTFPEPIMTLEYEYGDDFPELSGMGQEG